MEKIYRNLPKSKRNKFRVDQIDASNDVVVWMSRIKRDILQNLDRIYYHSTRYSEDQLPDRITCEDLLHCLREDGSYLRDEPDFVEYQIGYNQDEFTYLCIKQLANDGYLKLSFNNDTSDEGFGWREVMCFMDPEETTEFDTDSESDY